MQSCGNQVKNYDQKTELYISFFHCGNSWVKNRLINCNQLIKNYKFNLTNGSMLF